MSNISNRRQEILARLKTTLAIVSQATGFDGDRPSGSAGDSWSTEQQQWSSVRDPRLRRQENYPEEPGISEPGSGTGTGAVSLTTVSSSSVLHKFDIQDEDEFLYGSTTSSVVSNQQQQQVRGPNSDGRADDQRDVRLQRATQRPVREEAPQWTGTPTEHQPVYSNSPRVLSQHAGDRQWMRTTESTMIGRPTVTASSVVSGQQQQQVRGPNGDGRPDDQQDMRRQWATQRPVREEAPQWTGTFTEHQPVYSNSPQVLGQHAGDRRWMGTTESTTIGRPTDQSQWTQSASYRRDDPSWGDGSTQTLRYSNVADDRQLMGRVSQTAAGNVGMNLTDVEDRQFSGRAAPAASANVAVQPESVAGNLQGINAGMLENILKLVTAGRNAPPSSQPLPPQLQPPPQQQQLMQQQQPSFEHQHVYGSGYPPQVSYGQMPPDQRGYLSSGIPRDTLSGAVMHGHPPQLQHSMYDYGRPAPPQPQLPADVRPILNQLAASVLDQKMVNQPPVQPAADSLQMLTGLMQQTSSRSQPMSFTSTPASMDSPFLGNQPAERYLAQPGLITSTPLRTAVPEKQPPTTGMQTEHSVVRDVAGPAVVSQPERTATAETDKGGEGEQKKSGVDKDTLSQLLQMIGCSSNVTTLMQDLMKKDGQQTPPQQDNSSAPPATVEAAAAPEQPTVTTDNEAKPGADTSNVPSETPPHPDITDSKPESAERDETPKADLPLEPEKEPESKVTKSTIPVLSSLSRLQKNYDSGDEDAERDAAPATKNEDPAMAKDDEWERSTEEFLRRLQSKPATAGKSQKEESRSTSRDRTVKDKPKTTEGKKSSEKQPKSKAKKAKDDRAVGVEVGAKESAIDRAELLKGKHEIEDALQLLHTELGNLRTKKNRLLESPSDPQRNTELENSMEMERKLTDQLSQLKTAMTELTVLLEKQQPPTKVCQALIMFSYY